VVRASVGTTNRQKPTTPDSADVATKAAKVKHNWQAIRAEYVEAASEAARPTLEALANKHGCSPSYLRERSSKENWKLAAEQHLVSIATVRQTVKAERAGTEQANWDEQCFQLTKGALQQVYTHLKRSAEQKQPLELKELDLLTKSLERLHTLGNLMKPDQGVEEEAAADPSQYALMPAEDLAQLYQNRLKQAAKGRS